MTFKIKINPGGYEVTADEGESIIDATLRHGLLLPFGCRCSSCGACRGKVISGEFQRSDGDPDLLTAEEMAAGYTLFCETTPLSDMEIEAEEVILTGEVEVKMMPGRIAEMRKLADDVMEVKVRIPENQKLLFFAGQYMNILLDGGKRRSYSIANAPHDDEFLQFHVRLVDGGMYSGHVFEKMQVKDLVRLKGPMGSFFLREDSDRPIIFMATGTGFAPIKSMVEHAWRKGIKRPMHLFWGGRKPEDLYMHELAQQWANEHDNFSYTPMLSRANNGWSGETGYVQDAVVRAYPDLGGHDVYVCGSPVMIHAAKPVLLAHSLDEHRLHFDSFEFANDHDK